MENTGKLAQSAPHSTPWGASQGSKKIAPGIFQVHTASHGGIYVDRALQAYYIPKQWQQDWYEEDCDWAIACAFLKEHIVKNGGWDEGLEKHTMPTLKTWNPNVYEHITGETIPEGQSLIKDRDTYVRRYAGKLEVRSATMHPANWDGFVSMPGHTLVCAGPVGAGHNGERKYFVVPSQEYKERRQMSNGSLIEWMPNAKPAPRADA